LTDTSITGAIIGPDRVLRYAERLISGDNDRFVPPLYSLLKLNSTGSQAACPLPIYKNISADVKSGDCQVSAVRHQTPQPGILLRLSKEPIDNRSQKG
jgi:hypothetical protein